MGRVLSISRFYITNAFRMYLILVAALLLIHIIASLWVDAALGPARDAGIVTPLVLIASFSLGIMIFPAPFKYLVSQGISRRLYWLSTGGNLVMASILTSLLVVIYNAIFLNTVETNGFIDVYSGIYHNYSYIGLFVWEFSALVMLAVIGWLDRVIAYRSGPKVMIGIYAGVVIFWIGLSILNSSTGGVIFKAIGDFLRAVLGMETLNPYIASASFLTLSGVLYGCIYLLLRRAPVTE